MKTLTARDMEIIHNAPLFAGLPDNMLERLLAMAGVVEHSRGKLLFLRGQPAKRIYLLLGGWVKIFRDTTDGEQTVIAVLKPGETIAEAAIFLGWDYPASAEVVDDARLLDIPAKPFLKLLREDGDFALKLLGDLSIRLRNLVLHIEQLQSRSTPQRLGGFLLGLSEVKEGSALIQLPYDKSLVAARLGMKPESLSRALAKLKKYGVDTKGNEVRISDVVRLRGYCREVD